MGTSVGVKVKMNVAGGRTTLPPNVVSQVAHQFLGGCNSVAQQRTSFFWERNQGGSPVKMWLWGPKP